MDPAYLEIEQKVQQKVDEILMELATEELDDIQIPEPEYSRRTTQSTDTAVP
ncbi:MAG: hypothetical protein KDK30_11895 [Leptospiraceae bacterium]|nr:hypothetical protein [Leptospiraceae bacterium]MCB1320063.1 hypothetical protein [Leptospiraceae bacterium]